MCALRPMKLNEVWYRRAVGDHVRASGRSRVARASVSVYYSRQSAQQELRVKRLIMASCMRLAGISRGSYHLVQCRKFTSTTARRNDAVSTAVQKKPIGGFRGGYIIIATIFFILTFS
jgi:hypothetical protein